MLEFANALKNFDPASVTTYRIDSTPHTTSDGAQVEIPQIRSDNMQAILAVFRGEATLSSAPEQEFATTTTTARDTSTTSTTSTTPAGSDDELLRRRHPDQHIASRLGRGKQRRSRPRPLRLM